MMGMNHSKCAYWATIDGRESDLKYHISNGAELSRLEPSTGRSLMHIACERGDIRCVELINQCTRGRHLNLMDKDENTPLNLAVYWNRINTVSTLLKLGADPNYGLHRTLRFHRMPQHIASTKLSASLLQELLHYGCDVNARDSWGNTPLMVAINSKSLDCVKVLLQHQANTELREYLYSATPLQVAIHGKMFDAAFLLLEYGAETNVTGGNYPTPLVQVAELPNVPFIRVLLEFGAKPNVLTAYANKLHISGLIEEFSQPRRLCSLCRVVIRQIFKSDLPRARIAKSILSPFLVDYLMDLKFSKADQVKEEMKESIQVMES